jgi:hypothetical protein
MKKSLILLLTLILSPLVAGLYGVLHDQLTYTICHEYYTRYKFFQFGLVGDIGKEAILPEPRSGVAMVGFMATWWTGVIVGIGNGLVGLIHKDSKVMFAMIVKATLITLTITFITGLIGLAYGWLYLSRTSVDWWLPDNLIDKKGFIIVGSMHNFSYLGGVLGLCAAKIYQIIVATRSRRPVASS